MQVRPILRSVAAATGGLAEIWGNFRLLPAGNRFRQQASLHRLPSSLSSFSVACFQGQPFYATTSDRVGLKRVFQGRLPNRLHWVSLTRRSMSTGEEHGIPSTASDVKELKTPQDIIDFWFEDEKRFAKDKDYEQSLTGKWFGFGPKDESFIETQHAAKELIVKAASGELKGGDWDEPKGALAKILLLDQFPRTVYRGTKEAFAQDETAASLALEVISKDWDALGVNYSIPQRLFVYMPLMHSERLEAHNVCVEKMSILHKEEAEEKGEPPKPNDFATDHREVVAKFGRFPHRNAALGRESTPEEIEWLQSDDIPNWAKSQMS